MARLDEIRRLNADATHNCWAYNLSGGIMRFSDDGEPGGTAGMPIMDTLIRRGCENVIVIVTRFFGGILLGSGGLVRAYSRAASAALSQAGVVSMTPCTVLEFAVDYTRYGGVEGFIRANSTVDSIDFFENVRFRVTVECTKADSFAAEMVERTDGRVRPMPVGERYIGIPAD